MLVDLKLRIRRRRIFFGIPRFLLLSYAFCFALIWNEPRYPQDFAYPFLRKTSGRFKKHFLFDLYRGLDISFI